MERARSRMVSCDSFSHSMTMVLEAPVMEASGVRRSCDTELRSTLRSFSLSASTRIFSAASAALASTPALAQVTQAPTQTPPPPVPDAAELDPSAPLAPMPDLGVDWPDLNAKEADAHLLGLLH